MKYPFLAEIEGFSIRFRCSLGSTCFALPSLLVLLLCLSFAAGPVRSQCGTLSAPSTTWSDGNGSWSASGNWTSGTPNASTNACILDGTSTVTVDTNGNVAEGLQLASGNILNINAGASLSLASGVSLNSGTLNGGGTFNNNSSLTNYGVIEDAGRTLNNNSGALLTNFGGIDLGYGVVANSGTFVNGSGASISMSGISSAIINTGAGAYFGNSGTITILGSGWIYNSGMFNNSGAINASGGYDPLSMSNSGTLNNSGTISFDACYQYGCAFSNSGTFNNSGTFSLNGCGSYQCGGESNQTNTGGLNNSGTINLTYGASFSNSGVVNNIGGTLYVDSFSTVTNSGVLNNSVLGNFTSAGMVNNTGTLNNALGASLDNSGTMNNSGILNNSLYASLTDSGTINNSGTVANSGTVTITSSGLFTTSTNYTQNSGSTVVDGILTSTGGALVNIQGGTLSGTGMINGNVLMAGTMMPGDAPGTLTIFGNYEQTGSGVFDELIGPSASFLDVSGNVVLDPGALLDITLLSGYDPLGQRISIMDYSSLTGQFANGSSFWDDGYLWDITYSQHEVDVTAVQAPEPGSLLLLGIGSLAIGAFAKRKKVAQ